MTATFPDNWRVKARTLDDAQLDTEIRSLQRTLDGLLDGDAALIACSSARSMTTTACSILMAEQTRRELLYRRSANLKIEDVTIGFRFAFASNQYIVTDVDVRPLDSTARIKLDTEGGGYFTHQRAEVLRVFKEGIATILLPRYTVHDMWAGDKQEIEALDPDEALNTVWVQRYGVRPYNATVERDGQARKFPKLIARDDHLVQIFIRTE